MGFCSCTIKYLMMLFNLVCAVAGLIILIVGIIMNRQGGSFKNLISGQVSDTSIAIIIIGCAVFLIAFFGCCGAMRENTCMLQTYAVILLVILIAEIAVGITALVYKGKVEDALAQNGKKFFDNYDKNKDAIDEIQKDLECCGYKGPLDYTKLPNSCCTSPPCNLQTAFKKGCKEEITAQGKRLLNIIGAAAIIIGLIELICVLCAFYVSSSIKSQFRRGYA